MFMPMSDTFLGKGRIAAERQTPITGVKTPLMIPEVPNTAPGSRALHAVCASLWGNNKNGCGFRGNAEVYTGIAEIKAQVEEVRKIGLLCKETQNNIHF